MTDEPLIFWTLNPADQRTHARVAGDAEPARRTQRRVLMTTCQAHGTAGFTNLLVTKEGRFIVLNPHVANCCVLRLDEQVATALYHLFGEWLGYEPVNT